MSETKALRELKRAAYKVLDPLTTLLESVPQLWHDQQFYQRVRITEGTHTIQDKLAIYLLHQPDGLLRSTYLTAGHLVKKGYSIIAVSNAPLTGQDCEELVS